MRRHCAPRAAARLYAALDARRRRWGPVAPGAGGVAVVPLVVTALAGSATAVDTGDTAATAPALGTVPLAEPAGSTPIESSPAPSAAPPEPSSVPAPAVAPSHSTRAPPPSRPLRNAAAPPKTPSKPKRDPLGEQK